MIRGILVFLAVCVAVLVASPTVWRLLAAEFGTAPYVTIGHDGRHTPTAIGPESPWPEWAKVPPIKGVTPRYWYQVSGGGSVEFETSAYAARLDLAESLRGRGWTVRYWRQPTAEPGVQLPADHPLMACVMRGTWAGAPDRVFQIVFMPKSNATRAEAFWLYSSIKGIEYGAPEAC